MISQDHINQINNDLKSSIGAIPLDGQLHHFGADGNPNAKKKPLWVIGKTWDYKGNQQYVVTYGDFRGGLKINLSSYDVKVESPQFKKAHNEQVGKLEAEAKRVKEEKRQAGITKYKERFYKCNAIGAVSEYLFKKKISSNFCGRVDYRNTLMIPVESVDDDNNLMFEGVQMIFQSDTQGFAWVKVFNEGLSVRGSFTRLADFNIKVTEIIYLCEGFATAASVFLATGVATVCAFNSGNLEPVINQLKKLNPDVKIIICCDDDFQTIIAGKQINVGLLAAIKCKKQFPNVTYKKPIFSSRVDETDFNDLHVLEGLEVVREQLKFNRGEFVDIVLLGHSNHENFYYLCTQSKSIVSFKAYQHDGKFLKSLANEKYWGEKYGNKKEKDGTIVPNWAKVADSLLERQREIGPFDLKKMRGLGVWEDQNRIMVNFGSGVYRGDKGVVMSNIDPHLATKNFYKASVNEVIDFNDELTDDECHQILDAFKFLRFKNDYDFFYACGFIAVANIFSALDWRPHFWISGQAGTGKSWVLKEMSKLIHYKLPVKGSTVAGIKQALECDAKCVVYDEAEASPMISAVVELARQSSTKNEDRILRGSPTGDFMEFEANACFLMGSIQPPLMNKADDSRFFMLEMSGLTDQSAEEYDELMKRFDSIKGMGKRLMVRMVNSYGVLQQNIKLSKKWLRETGVQAREADQVATIIAGFVMLNKKTEMTKDDFDDIMQLVKLDKSDYVERNEGNDSDDCFFALTNLVLDNTGFTVSMAIDKAKNGVLHTSDLDAHGIEWVMGEGIFVANSNANLDKKMTNVGYPNFRKIMKRSIFYIESKSKRSKLFRGQVGRGLIFKW